MKEAIALHKQGKQIGPVRKKRRTLPSEFSRALAASKQVRAAFEALTPGRQREYADYVTEAKRERTRLGRVEKIIPMILAGKGLNDRYRSP